MIMILVILAGLVVLTLLILGIVFLTKRSLKKKSTSNIRYCVSCGKPIQQDAKYCTECGPFKRFVQARE